VKGVALEARDLSHALIQPSHFGYGGLPNTWLPSGLHEQAEVPAGLILENKKKSHVKGRHKAK
jgi:hypothetical protein